MNAINTLSLALILSMERTAMANGINTERNKIMDIAKLA